PSRPWAGRWNRRCRSHRPDDSRGARPRLHPGCSPSNSATRQWHSDPTPARCHPYPRIDLPDVSASATPPARCPPACTAAVLLGTPGPAAHTRLPPSVWPANPPSSQSHAPHRSPPAHPASLPTPADSAPAGWLAHSTPRSSVPSLQTSPPLPQDSYAPAPQTTHVHTCPADTPVPSRSTHTGPVPAPPR